MSSRDDFIAYTGQDFIEPAPRRVTKDLLNQPTPSSDIETSKESHDSFQSSGVRRDTLTGQIILTKEGGVEDVINVDDLRRKLAHLKENSHVKIRHLSGKAKDDFDSLAQYVAWIYNTDSYPLLYAEIQDYFHEDDIYQPGTVGAYCGGCLVRKKDGLMTRGCTVICAGSIPPPYHDPDWDFCSDLVIWAIYNGEGFEFTTLNEIENEEDDKAIIFVEQNSIEKFPGFNDAEKKTLKEHGISQIRLIHYDPSCDPMYSELSGGFVPIDQMKIRITTNASNFNPVVVNQGWNWWMIIIVAIILIALFFFLCRYFGRANW